MKQLAKMLKKFDIHAADGDIGKVTDLYFDDKNWTIRYLVIDTNKWLPGREVLLSPIEFDYVNLDKQQINIFASKEKIKNSPHIDTQKPISRQKELELSNYYGWNLYWTGPGVWGGFNEPYMLNGIQNIGQPDTVQELNSQENHLRSIEEVAGTFSGYRIKALDGDIGHVDDFLIEDRTWKINQIVINTKNWLPGRQILISPLSILEVNWHEKTVSINLTKEALLNKTSFDSSHLLANISN